MRRPVRAMLVAPLIPTSASVLVAGASFARDGDPRVRTGSDASCVGSAAQHDLTVVMVGCRLWNLEDHEEPLPPAAWGAMLPAGPDLANPPSSQTPWISAVSPITTTPSTIVSGSPTFAKSPNV